jgi:hypothetical protein
MNDNNHRENLRHWYHDYQVGGVEGSSLAYYYTRCRTLQLALQE